MRLLATVVASVWIAACSVDSAPLLATNVLVSKPVPGTAMGAAYLTLTNTTEQKITITAVSSPNFERVEMHESVLEDGVSRMRRLDELIIDPQQSTHFERGAKHLMMMRPIGSSDVVTLRFYAGETMLLSVDASFEG